ncbi:DNA recombination protein RmuC [Corynebacterium doosanense]|nr:DNA recombination protein RmuC [Corynebacterium doosanense]
MVSFFLALFIGLALGVVIGWLWRSARTPETPDTEAIEFVRQLAPLESAVDKLGGQLSSLEKDSASTYSALVSQVQAMTRTSSKLTDRTDKLVTALRAPQIRGRWGEMQLERVVELGGMVRHCDFDTQVSTRLGDRVLRPDLVVRLSGGRQLIVDAKVPFTAYLDAMETEDPEEQAAYMRRHAHLLRTHVTQLSDKNYMDAFSPTPEFVVAFVPADPFLDAALTVDPELLDYAFSRNIVVATPSTLFALFRTVALGWQQEDIADKAHEIQRLGRELHQRLHNFGEHYSRIGKNLEKAVDAYNSTLGSLDSRVMVTARKLADMDISTRARHDAPPVDPVTARARQIPDYLHGSAESKKEWD